MIAVRTKSRRNSRGDGSGMECKCREERLMQPNVSHVTNVPAADPRVVGQFQLGEMIQKTERVSTLRQSAGSMRPMLRS
jgi:hypothetical protein